MKNEKEKEKEKGKQGRWVSPPGDTELTWPVIFDFSTWRWKWTIYSHVDDQVAMRVSSCASCSPLISHHEKNFTSSNFLLLSRSEPFVRPENFWIANGEIPRGCWTPFFPQNFIIDFRIRFCSHFELKFLEVLRQMYFMITLISFCLFFRYGRS